MVECGNLGVVSTDGYAMRICFIVLCHHQPWTFRALVRHLNWVDVDVVVHLDKRSNISEFFVPGIANAHFMNNRKKVNRSGWSLTRTICEALDYGLTVSDANYFIYLAGTDFPIQPCEKFTRFLQEHYPANFLNWYPLVPGIWGYGLIDKYWLNDLKLFFEDARSPPRNSSKLYNMAQSLVIMAENTLNARFQPRNTKWIRFYSGSSRWCLNRETARFVVDYYRSPGSRKLRNYLQLCANSDEIFFQTAILNSKYKGHCLGFDESAAREIFAGQRPAMPDEKRMCFHYIDWSPEREDPAILDESDFERLSNSGKFFACKFTDDKSFGLVKMIEHQLLKTEM